MINLELIFNILIALFLYNVLIKAFVQTIMTQIFKNDVISKKKKTFRELLKDKLDEK
jgi:hypothetical protein